MLFYFLHQINYYIIEKVLIYNCLVLNPVLNIPLYINSNSDHLENMSQLYAICRENLEGCLIVEFQQLSL